MRFLVVAATESEAAYVPEGVDLVVTGLGKTAAAVATTRALSRYADPGEVTVLNIGTAGALREGLTGLFLPGTVWNHDFSAEAVRALGYLPRDVLEVGPGPVTLATGDLFVTDPAARDALAARADLVDMEGFAVAYAARELGAGIELVKHVSDAADESAWDWTSVVDRSARILGAWVGDRIHSP